MKTCGLVNGLTLVLVLMGCSRADSGNRVAVFGEVLVNGVLLPQGTITFLPMEGTAGPSIGGQIVNGKFDIPQSQGPVVGKHRVEILATRLTGKKTKVISESDGSEQILEEIEQYIPPRYNQESTLIVEVSSPMTKPLKLGLEISR